MPGYTSARRGSISTREFTSKFTARIDEILKRTASLAGSLTKPMTYGDRRLIKALTDIMSRETGECIGAVCVHRLGNPFSCDPCWEAYYAFPTSSSLVCGHFLFREKGIVPFVIRLEAKDHMFKRIPRNEQADLFDILRLNARIILESEKRKAMTPYDSGSPLLYVKTASEEKLFKERAIFASEVLLDFTSTFRSRVDHVLESPTTPSFEPGIRYPNP